MRPLLKLAIVLAVIGTVGIVGWHKASRWRPAPADYPLQGIDREEGAAAIDWPMVRAAGADFAYVVATSGRDRRDPAFEANWIALPEAGLRRGAVHVYSLCQPAIAQANAFNTFVPTSADALPMAVDVSFHDDCTARPDRAALIADLARFLTMVETHTGKPALLRIAKPVERTYTLTEALHRPTWEMANFRAPDYAARPWALWRASDIRRIDGVEGPVNWNVVAK